MSRLDSELVRLGLAQSRERAKEYILAGGIYVNGVPAKKPSDEVSGGDLIENRGESLKYVGRGGLKLEKALAEFGIGLSGAVCLDIGASTGGFTDCMLQSGAAFVYAVDVGHGQLAEKLVCDSRVENREGVNVKDLRADSFPKKIDFIASDLSFISCKFAADAAAKILAPGGSAVILLKPQFEAGRENISKGGIVKNIKTHISVAESILNYFSSLNFAVAGFTPSPIRGGDGNIEYLCHIVKQNGFTAHKIDVAAVCAEAFRQRR